MIESKTMINPNRSMYMYDHHHCYEVSAFKALPVCTMQCFPLLYKVDVYERKML